MSAHNILRELFDSEVVIADPGASGTIRVDNQLLAYVPVETAAAETRTLAQPAQAGLVCGVALSVDGGDMTLTVTGGYNQADTTTIVFGDVGDFVLFYSVQEGTSFYWRVLRHEGVAITEAALTATALTATTADVASLFAETIVRSQGNPTDLVDTAVTLTIAQLLTGIIVATPTANRQQTLPTGTLMSGGKAIAIGEAFEWSLVNQAATTHTETIAAGATHTIVGNAVVAAASTGRFLSRKTAATTWITYRIG